MASNKPGFLQVTYVVCIICLENEVREKTQNKCKIYTTNKHRNIILNISAKKEVRKEIQRKKPFFPLGYFDTPTSSNHTHSLTMSLPLLLLCELMLTLNS